MLPTVVYWKALETGDSATNSHENFWACARGSLPQLYREEDQHLDHPHWLQRKRLFLILEKAATALGL